MGFFAPFMEIKIKDVKRMKKNLLKCSERSNAEIKVREQNNKTHSIITSESVNIWTSRQNL